MFLSAIPTILWCDLGEASKPLWASVFSGPEGWVKPHIIKTGPKKKKQLIMKGTVLTNKIH